MKDCIFSRSFQGLSLEMLHFDCPNSIRKTLGIWPLCLQGCIKSISMPLTFIIFYSIFSFHCLRNALHKQCTSIATIYHLLSLFYFNKLIDLCEKYDVNMCLENVEWAFYNKPGFFTQVKNRPKQTQRFVSDRFGVKDGTWTHTDNHTPLKRTRLPIPPPSRFLLLYITQIFSVCQQYFHTIFYISIKFFLFVLDTKGFQNRVF